MKEPYVYSEGEWLVHSYYGLGQIKDIEIKGISGEETSYYRITTPACTFWVPVNQMNSDVMRPLSTPEEIKQAIAMLKKSPKEMSSDHKVRQNRIRRAQIRNTPKAIAQLIRDMRARRREKGVFSRDERSAFLDFKRRFVEEWAIVLGTDSEEVALTLDHLLDAPPVPAEEPSGALVT